MAIWIRPSGTEIEMDDNFDPANLRAIGWKKKRVPKAPQPETQQEDLIELENV
jgi:hypothetical protein